MLGISAVVILLVLIIGAAIIYGITANRHKEKDASVGPQARTIKGGKTKGPGTRGSQAGA